MATASSAGRASLGGGERRRTEEEVTRRRSSADGDEREEAGELKGQAEAQDGEGVFGEAVADAGAATVPVVRARRGERPHSGYGAGHAGQPGQQHRRADQQQARADVRSADLVTQTPQPCPYGNDIAERERGQSGGRRASDDASDAAAESEPLVFLSGVRSDGRNGTRRDSYRCGEGCGEPTGSEVWLQCGVLVPALDRHQERPSGEVETRIGVLGLRRIFVVKRPCQLRIEPRERAGHQYPTVHRER